MPIYAVQYVYDPNRNDDRDTHRPEHRGYLQSLADEGSMLVRGPYSDHGAAGALLVLRADPPDAVAAALDPDPFNREGLILDRVVREWNPIGNDVFG